MLMYLVLCLHHLYGIQALLKSLLKHHLTQQKMHLTIFIKTMKSFEVIVLHSFYPLHLKSRYNYNHLPRIWFFFDESNTGTSSSAWRWHPMVTLFTTELLQTVDSTDLLLKVELKLQKYFTTETRPIV